MNASLYKAYRKGLNLLKSHRIEEARIIMLMIMKFSIDARLLDNRTRFEGVILKSRYKNTLFSKGQYNRFGAMLVRTLNDIPIQYNIGYCYFNGNKILCRKPVFIPRPETEDILFLVHTELNKWNSPKKVRFLEIGVGSGCIFISIIKHISKGIGLQFTGIDKLQESIILSRENAALNKITDSRNVDVKLVQIPFENFTLEGEPFDFIVSNPPYIREDYNPPRNMSHESEYALFSGEDGLDMIRLIIVNSTKLVKRGGFCILEISPEQEDLIIDFIRDNDIQVEEVKFHRDIYDRVRFLSYSI